MIERLFSTSRGNVVCSKDGGFWGKSANRTAALGSEPGRAMKEYLGFLILAEPYVHRQPARFRYSGPRRRVRFSSTKGSSRPGSVRRNVPPRPFSRPVAPTSTACRDRTRPRGQKTSGVALDSARELSSNSTIEPGGCCVKSGHVPQHFRVIDACSKNKDGPFPRTRGCGEGAD